VCSTEEVERRAVERRADAYQRGEFRIAQAAFEQRWIGAIELRAIRKGFLTEPACPSRGANDRAQRPQHRRRRRLRRGIPPRRYNPPAHKSSVLRTAALLRAPLADRFFLGDVRCAAP
jgi:hypothetical protein